MNGRIVCQSYALRTHASRRIGAIVRVRVCCICCIMTLQCIAWLTGRLFGCVDGCMDG